MHLGIIVAVLAELMLKINMAETKKITITIAVVISILVLTTEVVRLMVNILDVEVINGHRIRDC